jgi:malate dehydrogenase (oxaloacetate-decarboxylating)
LDTQDVDTVRRFSAASISKTSPRCFEIESRLQNLGIPVFHDDQHGTAIVLLAGSINAAKVLGRDIPDLKIVINGAGRRAGRPWLVAASGS